MSALQVDIAIRRINHTKSHWIEAAGLSGGIWLLWKDDLNLTVFHNHKQFVHVAVADLNGTNSYLFTAIYGRPTPFARECLWRNLLQLRIDPIIQWLLVGDLNSTINRGRGKVAQLV